MEPFEARDQFAFDYRMHEGSAMRVSHHFAGHTGMPVAIQTWVIAPGGFEGFHRHDGEGALQEFYQVLEGQARMRLGARTYDLGPGDSVIADAGVDHDLHNTGGTDLRVLTIWGPPGAADFSAFGSHQLAQQVRGAHSK